SGPVVKSSNSADGWPFIPTSTLVNEAVTSPVPPPDGPLRTCDQRRARAKFSGERSTGKGGVDVEASTVVCLATLYAPPEIKNRKTLAAVSMEMVIRYFVSVAIGRPSRGHSLRTTLPTPTNDEQSGAVHSKS